MIGLVGGGLPMEGKMTDDGSFFGFILGALMAGVVCGVMLFATGNFVVNSSNMKMADTKIESALIPTAR